MPLAKTDNTCMEQNNNVDIYISSKLCDLDTDLLELFECLSVLSVQQVAFCCVGLLF